MTSPSPKTKFKILSGIYLMALVLAFSQPGFTNAQTPQSLFKGMGPWYEKSATGDIKLYLYFFWSKECPHCRRAKPFLEELQSRLPWVLLQQKEVTEYPENKALFHEMVDSLGETSRAVPTLMFCGGMVQGFDKPENTGVELTSLLKDCHQQLNAFLAPPKNLPEIPPQPRKDISLSGKIMISGLILALGAGALFWRTRWLKK